MESRKQHVVCIRAQTLTHYVLECTLDMEDDMLCLTKQHVSYISNLSRHNIAYARFPNINKS